MDSFGILYALLAVVGWGVGDFLIQRSTRKVGDWEALFFITFFATVVLFPFVYKDFQLLSALDWLLLIGTSVVILVAALLDFEALRVGKIAVIQPVYAIEVPITIALATLVIGEHLSRMQIVLVMILLVGVFLISTKKFAHIRFTTLERGVLVALLAATGMGASNFLYGLTSRTAGPLIINWFSSAFMACATLVYLLWTARGKDIVVSWRKNKLLILSVGFFDIVAWVGYSVSTLSLPIGLVTGLTESYIVVSAVLGIYLNKERLLWHQKMGLAIAVCAALLLAYSAMG